MSMASDIQRKIDNAGACSHLDCAIWFIRQANKLWPFQHAAGLIETLQQLKAKIKNEIGDRKPETGEDTECTCDDTTSVNCPLHWR